MATNLGGNNLVRSFSVSGADPKGPYTNTGGANQAASLTLTTTAANVSVTEAANAIGETTQPISVAVMGAGKLIFLGTNTYSGGTIVDGSRLAIKASGALGSGGATVVNGGTLSIEGDNVNTANTLTLNGSGVSNGGALRNVGIDDLSLNRVQSVVLASASRINADVGSLNVGGTVTGAGQTLTVGGNGAVTFAGAIQTGTGGVTKDGDGAMFLVGVNTYTGTTTVSRGAVQLLNGSAIADTGAVVVGTLGSLQVFGSETVGSIAGSGTIILSGVTLTTGGNGTSTTFSGSVTDNGSGIGSLVKTGAGTLSLSGANGYSGGTTVSAGRLNLVNAGTNAAVASLGGGAVSIAAAANLTITNSDAVPGDFKLANTISGGGALVVGGSAGGFTTLSGSNIDYTGTVTVSAGTLQIGNADALGTIAGGTRVFGGATLQVEGDGLALGDTLTLSGTGVGGGGALRNLGVGSGSGNQVKAIVLGAAARIASDAGLLSITGPTTGTNMNLTLGGAGTVAVSGAIQTGTGTLTKDGAGMVTLSGANTYAGTTTVSAGTLVVQNGGALGTADGATTVASGATLKLDGAFAIGDALTLSGTGVGAGGALRATSGGQNGVQAIALAAASRINADAGQLFLNGVVTGTDTNLALGGAGVIAAQGAIQTGSGTLTVDGTGTVALFGANTYTGATTVASGSLQLFNGSAIADSAAVVVSASGALVLFGSETVGSIVGGGTILLSGATLTAGGDNSSTTYSGSMINNGAAVGSFGKIGTGTLTLSGSSSYSGTTTVSAGTLVVRNGGALGTADGATTVADGATLKLDGAFAIGDALTLSGAGVGAGGALRATSAGQNGVQAVALAAASRINADAGQLFLNGTVTGTNTNLTLGGAGAISAQGAIQIGSGTLTVDGTGAVGLFGTNTSTGATTVASGVLQLYNGSAIADSSAVVVTAPAQLVLFASETVGSIAGGGTIFLSGATLTAGGDNSSTTYSGSMTNNGAAVGSFAKIGTGTLTLSGSSSYSGSTTVSAGTLAVQNAGALGTTAGGTTVTSGATLRLDGTSLTIADALTLSGAGVGGGGALRNASSVNEVQAVSLNAASRINSDGTAVLFVTGTVTGQNQNLTLGGGGVVKLYGSLQTGTGTLTKDGTGIAFLYGADTFTGSTRVVSGSLILVNGAAIGDMGAVTVDAAGTLAVDNSETVGSIAGSGTIRLESAALTAGGAGTSTTFAGRIVDTGGTDVGSLVKAGAGTLTLSGANTYSNGTTISGGTLKLLNASTTAAVASLGSGGVSIASGATLDVSNADKVAGDFVLGNAISGAGAVVYGGPSGGITTVTGSNGYAGTTTVNAGTLVVRTANALGATSQGTTVASGATLKIEGAGFTLTEPLTLNGTGVGNGGALRSSTGASSFDRVTAITIGSASRINSDAGVLQLEGTISGANVNLALGGAATTSILASVRTGTGTVTKDGTGVVAFYGANTYTGVTTVLGGQLQLLSGSAIADAGSVVIASTGSLTLGASETVGSIAGSGAVYLINATLTTGGDGTSTTYAGTIANANGGGGGLVKSGAGTLTLSGANTYAGGTTVGGGRLKLLNAGTASADASLGGGGVSIASGATLEVSNADATASGAAGGFVLGNTLSGAGAAVYGGPSSGITTVTGSNTYAGRTTVNAGTLVVTTANALGASDDYTQVASGATLTIRGSGVAVADNLVLSGTGVGNGGALRNVGTGDPAGTNTVQNLRLTSAARINSDAGLLQINGVVTATNLNLTFGGAGIAFALSTIQTGSGTVTKDGSGVVALYGANTYSGATTVSDGYLDLLGGAAIADGGAVAVDAPGTLRFFTSETVGSIAGSGAIVLANGAALTAGGNGTATAFSGVIGDFDSATPGSLVKEGAGTLTLSGTNSYGGGTTINGGTLRLLNTSTTSPDAALGSGAVVVAGGAVLQVTNSDTVEGGDAFTLAAPISGTGALVFDGPNGAYTAIRGANSYSGGTTILSGIVEIGTDAAFGTGTVTMTGGAIRAVDSPKTLANSFVLGGTIGLGFATGITGSITLASNTVLTPSLNAGGSEWSGALALGAFRLATGDSGPNAAGATWAGSDLTLSGVISGSGGVKQGSAGGLVLNGANTYTGGTVLSAGSITIGNAAALGTGTVSFAASGTALQSTVTGTLKNALSIGSGVSAAIGASAGGVLTLTGVIAGTGSLTKTGDGSVRLARVETLSGAVTIAAGTLALTGAGSLAAAAGVSLGANATFDVSDVTAGATVRTLGGAGPSSVVSLGGRQLTVAAATDATSVTYLSAPGLASSLLINMASPIFTLTSASFGNWTAGEDTITINGTDGADQIVGSALDDILKGGLGADTMSGGAGNDTYYVDNPLDQVVDSAGLDTVHSTQTWTLGSDVESLILDGTGAINGTGNGAANTITGNDGVNVIEGGGNADTLLGGAGGDTFIYRAGFGKDVIGDFAAGSAAGHDAIQIAKTLFADYAALMGHTTDTAAGATVAYDAQNTITLTGVTTASLASADFTFV